MSRATAAHFEGNHEAVRIVNDFDVWIRQAARWHGSDVGDMDRLVLIDVPLKFDHGGFHEAFAVE